MELWLCAGKVLACQLCSEFSLINSRMWLAIIVRKWYVLLWGKTPKEREEKWLSVITFQFWVRPMLGPVLSEICPVPASCEVNFTALVFQMRKLGNSGHTEWKNSVTQDCLIQKPWAKASYSRDEEKNCKCRRNGYKTTKRMYWICLLFPSTPRKQRFLPLIQFTLGPRQDVRGGNWMAVSITCKWEPPAEKNGESQQCRQVPVWCYIFPSKVGSSWDSQRLQPQVGPADWDWKQTTGKET